MRYGRGGVQGDTTSAPATTLPLYLIRYACIVLSTSHHPSLSHIICFFKKDPSQSHTHGRHPTSSTQQRRSRTHHICRNFSWCALLESLNCQACLANCGHGRPRTRLAKQCSPAIPHKLFHRPPFNPINGAPCRGVCTGDAQTSVCSEAEALKLVPESCTAQLPARTIYTSCSPFP